jgi:hypothetical protein
MPEKSGVAFIVGFLEPIENSKTYKPIEKRRFYDESDGNC